MASLLWKWQITLGPLYFLGSALQTAWNQIELKEQNSASSAELPARAGICCSARQADPLVCGRFARLASELLFSLYLRLWSCIICSCTSQITWPGCWIFADWIVTFDGHQSCTACDSCPFIFSSQIFSPETLCYAQSLIIHITGLLLLHLSAGKSHFRVT